MNPIDPSGEPRPASLAAHIAHGRQQEFFDALRTLSHPDRAPGFTGQTLLHFAVGQKKTWAVGALLAAGADPNLMTMNRMTALDIARDPSSPAPKDIMEMLLQKGAKSAAALTLAERHNQLEDKYKLLAAENPPDVRALLVIVRNHPQKEQGFVLDYMQRNYGHSPLHAAAEAGSVAMVKFWLDLGLPAGLRTRGGKTPLDMELQKECPNEEILDVIGYYARRQKEQGRCFFGGEGEFIDETDIALPPDATLDDLRKPQSAVATDTLMYRLARFGDAGLIRDAALSSRQDLSVDDLVRPTHAWKSVIEIAAGRGQAGALLDPRLWKGRGEELRHVIAHLGPAYTQDIDIEAIFYEAGRLALKEKARRRGGFKL